MRSGRWDSRAGKGQTAALHTESSLVCIAGQVDVHLAEREAIINNNTNLSSPEGLEEPFCFVSFGI